MDAAQSTNNDNNRVTFVPTGSEVNGYTSAVVQTTTAVSAIGARKKVTNTLSCLRVGEVSYTTYLPYTSYYTILYYIYS